MLEIAIVSVFVAIAFVAVGRSSHPALTANVAALQVLAPEETSTDLPCPWCLAQTREDDRSCPTCGQPFG
ncbi:MAG: hypothetical protein ABFR89_03155 [Actinomycetota bacterium]